jgi:hypothetical protein
MPVQFVSSARPYDAQERDIERKRQQAQVLRQQAAQFQEPIGQNVSGHFVAKNPLSYAADLLRNYSAGHEQRGAEKLQQDLLKKKETERMQLAGVLRGQDDPNYNPIEALGDLSTNEMAQNAYNQIRLQQLSQKPQGPDYNNDLLIPGPDGSLIPNQALIDVKQRAEANPADSLLVRDEYGNLVPNEALIKAKAQIAGAGSTKITNEMNLPRGELTPGEEAVDKNFATEVYTPFVTGGFADARKNAMQLKEARAVLESGANLTGPAIGLMPDVVKNFTNPESVSTKEAVEEVVQRNLREILGAQFTENEGKRLIARAYNPNLEEAENIKRLNRLITSIEDAYNAKVKAVNYFNENRTLSGYSYNIPSLEDFEKAINGGPIDGENKKKTDKSTLNDKKQDPLGIRGD